MEAANFSSRNANLIKQARHFYAEGEPLFSAIYAEAVFFEMNAGPAPEATLKDSLEAVRMALTSTTNSYAKSLAHYQTLIATAKATALASRARAHAPFSNFLVGAALIADDETIVAGCNVESSSYGLTICAERTALVSGVAQGRKRYAAVVVAADTPVLTPPCGACRQMLYDFAPDAVVILVNPQGNERWFTMKELLPEAFSVAFLT